jgi:hypothetical protein
MGRVETLITDRNNAQFSIEVRSDSIGHISPKDFNALDLVKPNKVSDILPPDPFGNIDHQLLALNDTACWISTMQSQTLSGRELVHMAEKLGYDPHRWAQTKESPSPKCNQYVEAVLMAAHVPFPWKAGTADCRDMRTALDKECAKPDGKWEKVYTYDYQHGAQSDQRFTHYRPKDGDVMIWDGIWGNEYVQHSGIVAEPYDLLYAGSESPHAPHGWRHGEITELTMSRQHYGAPTAVYRFKQLHS